MKARMKRFLDVAKTPSSETISRLDAVLSELAGIRAENESLRRDNADLRAELRASINEVAHTSKEVRAFILDINHRTMVTEEIVSYTKDHILAIHHLATVTEALAAYTKEQLLTTNHHVLTTRTNVEGIQARTDQSLQDMSAQLKAERDATMASNDSTRRMLLAATEALVGFVDHQRARPHLTAAVGMLDQAQEIVDIARSQYTDAIPLDATGFASVTP